MKDLVKDGKYWRATVEGSTLRTQFGKLGHVGQTRLKPFATPAEAEAAMAVAIAAKQGEGFRPAGKAAAKPAAKPDRRREALVELATRLGGARVATQVALAIDAPDRYAARFAARIEDGDRDPDTSNFAWLALVDALEAARRLASLDWKHPADDALAWIRGLASKAGKAALAPLIADTATRATDDALRQAAAALATTGEALLQLDINSDSYELVVVPADAVAELVALARAARERLVPIKAKAGKPRPAPPEPKDNAWTALLDASTFGNTYDALQELRTDDGVVKKLRAALPHVPRADRPLVELVLRLNEKTALATARTIKDPALALQAASYMRETSSALIVTRLRVVALLAERFKLVPKPGKHTEHAAFALYLSFADDDEADRALARVPAAERDLLARLADATLATARRGTDAMMGAVGALGSVGDARSIEALAARGIRKPKGDLGDAVERIRARS